MKWMDIKMKMKGRTNVTNKKEMERKIIRKWKKAEINEYEYEDKRHEEEGDRNEDEDEVKDEGNKKT